MTCMVLEKLYCDKCGFLWVSLAEENARRSAYRVGLKVLQTMKDFFIELLRLGIATPLPGAAEASPEPIQ